MVTAPSDQALRPFAEVGPAPAPTPAEVSTPPLLPARADSAILTHLRNVYRFHQAPAEADAVALRYANPATLQRYHVVRHSGSIPLAVMPPLRRFAGGDPARLSFARLSASAMDGLLYIAVDAAAGRAVAQVVVRQQPAYMPPENAGKYAMTSFGGENQWILEALKTLSDRAEVRAGSYEPCLVNYAQWPVGAAGSALWLRSPDEERDLFCPLPDANGLTSPGLERQRVYPADEFIQIIKTQREIDLAARRSRAHAATD